MGGERLQRLDASTWEEIKVPFEYRKDAPMDIRTSPDGAFISLHYFQSGTRVMTEDFGRVVGLWSGAGRVLARWEGRGCGETGVRGSLWARHW